MGAGKRIAQEAQLLAEERWLVNALKGIRSARNCLQIERLQLESTLAHHGFRQLSSDPQPISDTSPASSTPDSGTGTEAKDSKLGLVSICNTLSTASTATESRVRDLDDGVCNFEELNLSVTRPVFNVADPLDFNVDFEEEDDSEEEEEDYHEDEENMEIDMNMFMNSDREAGAPTSRHR